MDLLRKKTMRKCKRAFQFGISATGLQSDFFKNNYQRNAGSGLSELRNKKTVIYHLLIETQLTFSL